MNSAYDELKSITDKYYSDWVMPEFEVFEKLLFNHGIALRKDDGDARYATFSVPSSKQNALVLGIRYVKKDGTYTEDLFLFEIGKPVQSYYKGKLEKILPEYKGTHKLQFKEELKKGGYDKVYEWIAEPFEFDDNHMHPFDTKLLILEGELELGINGHIRRLMPMDSIEIPRNQIHYGKAGKTGCRYIVAERE